MVNNAVVGKGTTFFNKSGKTQFATPEGTDISFREGFIFLPGKKKSESFLTEKEN